MGGQVNSMRLVFSVTPMRELVAVVDKDLDRAKSFSDIFKVPYYHSIAQLLRDKNDEFDGACICTLPSTHFEL